MSENINWDKYSKIVSSEYRSKILLLLLKKSLTPKQISVKTNIIISHVSRALQELKKLNLVKCLTSPTVKKGKIYTTSEEGKIYAKEILKNLEK
ncbi:MAG: ArsR family transcriptional regulator [Promethearchaeota archaeon]